MSGFKPQPNTPTQTHALRWEGIEIEIRYTPVKWGSISHIEIEAIEPPAAPLPITPTGYKSKFVPIGEVESYGADLVSQVRSWLEDEAKSEAWKSHVEDCRQGSLF